jgi:hypothetical protein
VGEDYSSAGPDDGQFETRWSTVLGAVQSRTPCAQKALAELCGLDWRPLYAFARRRACSPEHAPERLEQEQAVTIRTLRNFLTASLRLPTRSRERPWRRRHPVKIMIPRPPKSFFEG